MTETRYQLLDRPEITRVLFHPRPEFMAFGAGGGGRPVQVPVGDGVSIGGRLYVAAPEAPVILYFHGNGELAAEYDGIARLYTAIGASLLVMDYRGYGTSGGRPSSSTLISDARGIYQATPELLAANGVTSRDLFVMGRSLGSASALEIADHAGDAIRGLIIESGFAYTLELVARLGGMRLGQADEAAHGFGNLEKIARVTVPTLIIHGQEDWIIPVRDGHALHEHAGAADKRLLVIPGAGHNDILFTGQTAYFQAIREFVTAHSAG